MEEIIIHINDGKMRNADVCIKNVMRMKKIFWNPAKFDCKSGKYLANIMCDSAIMRDEIIESYKKDSET